MDNLADYLATLVADLGEVVLSGLPVLCGIGWLLTVLVFVAMPLGQGGGFVLALMGTALVWAAGTVLFIIVAQRMVERRRERAAQARARWVASIIEWNGGHPPGVNPPRPDRGSL
jgi:hypothetical protein